MVMGIVLFGDGLGTRSGSASIQDVTHVSCSLLGPATERSEQASEDVEITHFRSGNGRR